VLTSWWAGGQVVLTRLMLQVRCLLSQPIFAKQGQLLTGMVHHVSITKKKTGKDFSLAKGFET
jgi:hypothetical protein